MTHYVQSLPCKKIFAASLLIGAVVFLFMYSDNTWNSYYYDDDFLEFVNISYDTTENPDELEIATTVEASTNRGVTSLQNSNLDRRKITFTEEPLKNASVIKENYNSIDFLVWSPECRIPNFDPFSQQGMKFFHKEKYSSCSKHKLLSYVNISDNKATLYVDKKVLPSYTNEDVYCCYSYVTRHGSRQKPDQGIRVSKCIPFKDSQLVTNGTIKISCKTKNLKKVYDNVHEAITIREEFRKLKKEMANVKPPSILFIGIDSVSRLNLMRAMPKTNDFLLNRNDTWLPLYGYNKIGENTFPNLMAIFTGYNDTEAYKICNPKEIGPLDSCRFIWKDYKKFGYVTAYAEDETSINTFNYKKKGFIKEPVDYYFRPYMEAAERLGTVKVETLSYCTGPETSGERIMNLARNFATTYKDYPSFGFFWMNTFSHNNINTVSRMDEKVMKLLEDITDAGILDNSIVIFLSDHGMRFGKIRSTFTGWLEERLPFIFISFPKWFKEKYPDAIRNYQVNANRLTTPYDLHITLQHILVLSQFNYTMKKIDTCPLCQSLFTKLPQNRSCESSGITPHWCTCSGYSRLDEKKQTVAKGANFLLDEVQKFINKKGGNKKCAKYHLGKILTSYISEQFSYKNDTYLLIAIETIPKAVFESTLHFKTDAKNNPIFSIESSISRLDSYAQHGQCVEDERLKQYCFCI